MPNKGKGIFLVYTDLIDDKYDEEFNAWYNTQHLPDLLRLPGFLSAARYQAVKGGPKYLAVYELVDADAAKGLRDPNRQRPPWDRRMSPQVIGKNHTRVLGTQIFPDGVEQPDRELPPALQIGRMSVPAEVEAEWNAWYNGEYIPGYRKVPGVIYARRYRVLEGEVAYTTVYEFENPEVSESKEWLHQRANSSPNSDRMRAAIQMAEGSPGVYRRIYP